MRPESRSALHTVVRQDRVCLDARLAAEMLCWTGSAWERLSVRCLTLSEVDCLQHVALSPHRVVLAVDGLCQSPAHAAAGPLLFGAQSCSFVEQRVYYQQTMCMAEPAPAAVLPCTEWDTALVASALAALFNADARDRAPLAAFVTHYDAQQQLGRAIPPTCADIVTRVQTRLQSNTTRSAAAAGAVPSVCACWLVVFLVLSVV